MAEEQQGQERTEQPTAKRLTEARKKGQVARSRELNTLLVMLASAVALWLLSGPAMSGLTALFSDALSPTGDVLRQAELCQSFDAGALSRCAHLSFLAITVVAALAGPALGRATISRRCHCLQGRETRSHQRLGTCVLHRG